MMVAEPENFIEQVAKSNTVDEASGMSTVVNYRCVIYFSSPDLLFLFFSSLFLPLWSTLHVLAYNLHSPAKPRKSDLYSIIAVAWFAGKALTQYTFHIETTESRGVTQAIIDQIKATGMRVGLALNPATPIEVVMKYADQCDMVLVMTVVPGKGA